MSCHPVTATPTERTPPSARQLAAAAALLAAQPEYRVLRALERPTRLLPHDIEPPPAKTLRRALLVDVQTTGIDPATAHILEIGCLPVRFDPVSGTLVEAGRGVSGFADPGQVIPEAVTRRTGITNAMTAGKQLPLDQLARLFTTADLVIAHHARFDRPIVERLVPAARECAWACSASEVAWEGAGYLTPSLEVLLATHARQFFKARRSLDHCYAMLALLRTPFPPEGVDASLAGQSPFQRLLQSARTPSAFLWAPYTHFDMAALFRERGWHFDGGEKDVRPKAWYATVPAERKADETRWMRDTIYRGQPPRAAVAVMVKARSRYSELSRIERFIGAAL